MHQHARFEHIKRTVADLADDLDSLEKLLDLDVPSSLNKIRFITEKTLQALCRKHGVAWGQAEPTLERMVGPLVSSDVIPRNIAIHVRTIQANTSPGSHYQESPLSTSHAAIAQNALIEFLDWYCRQWDPLANEVRPPGKAADGTHPVGRRGWARFMTGGALVLLFTALAVWWHISSKQQLIGPTSNRTSEFESAATESRLLGSWEHRAWDGQNWVHLSVLSVAKAQGGWSIAVTEQEQQTLDYRIAAVDQVDFDGDTLIFSARYVDGTLGHFRFERVSDSMFRGTVNVEGSDEPEYQHRITRLGIR
jgi:hypothetical protein